MPDTHFTTHVYVSVCKQAIGLTGAEIEGVCREAAMLALREQGILCSTVAMRYCSQVSVIYILQGPCMYLLMCMCACVCHNIPTNTFLSGHAQLE